MKLVLSIGGASGSRYGLRLLEELKKKDIETILIISETAKQILKQETKVNYQSIASMANKNYSNDDLFAPPSSGSFQYDGMIVAPCSMKTLSSIANGYGDTLSSRAALCCLKENRKLVLVPRETPLNRSDIQNMLLAKENGAVILPAMPGFYHNPNSIENLVDFIVGKILDQFNIDHSLFKRWKQR